MPRKQRYIHKSDFMSERMLLLNTVLAGVHALKVGLLVTIAMFLIGVVIGKIWTSAWGAPLFAYLCGPAAVVITAVTLLVAHYQQMPTLRRAAIGILGLHLPIVVPWFILAVVIPAWRFGGRGFLIAELFSFGKFFAISMLGGFIIWAGTRLVLGSTRVVSQMECTACGYSLMGLTSNICPECGDEIRDAVDVLGKGDARPMRVKDSVGDSDER